MKEKIRKLSENSVVRYLFFGGLTTFVNFASFTLFTKVLRMELNLSNVISVSLSILFAYFVNSRFVFRSEARGLRQRFPEFVKFVSSRLVTMAIEVVGVWFLVKVVHLDELVAKLIVQGIVIVTNYVLGKFLVFMKKKPPEGETPAEKEE
ncbi:MAG: GtrA family protein [Clostridia bacterium]|nr:GtrA family protein [Clostridia bacterium]